jgi:hypothetical protein
MTSPAQRYLQEMHDNIGFFATWLPGDLLEIGDVGVWKNNKFHRQATLKELGIPYAVSKPGSTQNLQFASKGGTSISIDGSIAAPPPYSAAASIKVEFSQEGAFVFHASNIRNRRLENTLDLKAAVLESFKANVWQKDWKLIESLHMAECVTIIVSEDKAAGLTLQANAKDALGALPLASPDAKVSIKASNGRMVRSLPAKISSPSIAASPSRSPGSPIRLWRLSVARPREKRPSSDRTLTN